MKRISILNVKIKIILLITFSTVISIFTGCNSNLNEAEQFTTSSNTSVSTQIIQASPETTIDTKPSINLRIFASDDRMMLIPAAIPDYDRGVEIGEDLFYTLSDDMTCWEPVNCKVTKIDSVTGRRFYEEQDSTIDIFQIKIGDWIGYYKRNSELRQDYIERRLLLEDNLVCEPRSKDYTILKLFDDLYAIGDDGILKMVSSRKVDSFDYATIQKDGIGDLYGWSWVYYPVCSVNDNIVFYLTAREREFYSIWKLNLDNGTEKRFGHDVAFRLDGIGDNQLIALMDGDHGNSCRKLISTSDSESFTEMIDKGWASSGEWLFYQNDMDLKFIKENTRLEINAGRTIFPIILTDNVFLFAEQSPRISNIQYIRVDLENVAYSTSNAGYHNTLEGWNRLLTDLKSNEHPIGQAADNGIKIVLK